MLVFGRWTMIDSIDFDPALTTVPADTIHWETCSDGNVPHGAVTGGKSLTGEVLYIGRTRLIENRNELTPGIIFPSEKCLLVSYGTGVRRAKEYEALVSKEENVLHWMTCKNGDVPRNSVIGGIDCSYLEPLYIGRTRGDLLRGKTWRGKKLTLNRELLDISSDVHIPGKVHRTHKCLYIPHMGKEYLFREYEVLVMKQSPASLSTTCRVAIRTFLSNNFQPKQTQDENYNIAEKTKFLSLPEKLKEYIREETYDNV